MNALSKQTYTTASAIKLGMSGAQPSMIVSTAALDRDGDRVFPKGANLKNFLENPVLCWGHSRTDIPAGIITSVSVDEVGIRITWRWLENDPLADRVKNAWDQGIVRAASIGFIPLRSERNAYGGQDHFEWELLEVSLVPVPSNPTAVRQLKGLGLWGDEGTDGSVEVDLVAINRSMNQIDLSNLEFDEPIEGITVTTEMVEQILERMKPALVAGLKAGVKLQAERAAHEVFCRMTGRLD